MPELITEPDLRGMFDIHTDVAESRLTPAIRAAARRLRSMVDAAAYADAISETPTDADRKDDFQYAMALLAMHFSIIGLNTQIRPTGVVKTEKIEGETVVQYLSPGEMAATAQLYLDQAEAVLRPWKSDELPATAELVETEADCG